MKRTLFALIALAALGAHSANAQVRVSVSVARPGIRIVGEYREAPRPGLFRGIYPPVYHSARLKTEKLG